MRNQLTGALSLDLSQDAVTSLAETIADILTDRLTSSVSEHAPTAADMLRHPDGSTPRLRACDSGEALQAVLDTNELDGSLAASRLVSRLYDRGYVIARPATPPAPEPLPDERVRNIAERWFGRAGD